MDMEWIGLIVVGLAGVAYYCAEQQPEDRPFFLIGVLGLLAVVGVYAGWQMLSNGAQDLLVVGVVVLGLLPVFLAPKP
jgi:hypothetical protein